MDDKYLNKIYQLKNIIRYNNKERICNESVAEHSFYVALISIKLCEEYNIDENLTNQIILKSLLHDMPEIEINDITHDAKIKLNLTNYLKQFEDEYFRINFPKYSELMTNCKNEIINTIVDLSDAYSVKQFVNKEMKLGNKSDSMLYVYDEITNRIDSLKNKLEGLL